MNISPSSRLNFRLMDRNDADLFYELDQDPEVMKYINGGNLTTPDEIKNIFIPRLEKYRDKEKGFGLWQVNVKDENKFIGWILVRPMKFFSDSPEMNNIEIGWRFKKMAWGKGYATEAAKQVINALSVNPSFAKFSAIALPENRGSIRIMEKLGMQYARTEVEDVPALGKVDVVCYEMENNGIIDSK